MVEADRLKRGGKKTSLDGGKHGGGGDEKHISPGGCCT